MNIRLANLLEATQAVSVTRDKGYPIEGEKIRRWYRANGFGQREFAQLLEISDAGLRLIENGTTQRIQPKTLRRLAAAMKLTPEQAAQAVAPSVPGTLPPEEVAERVRALAEHHAETVAEFLERQERDVTLAKEQKAGRQGDTTGTVRGGIGSSAPAGIVGS